MMEEQNGWNMSHAAAIKFISGGICRSRFYHISTCLALFCQNLLLQKNVSTVYVTATAMFALTGTRRRIAWTRPCSRRTFHWRVELRPWRRWGGKAYKRWGYWTHSWVRSQRSQTQPWGRAPGSPSWAAGGHATTSRTSGSGRWECLWKD